MVINNANIGSDMVWNKNTAAVKAETVGISNAAKPANIDRFVLNLPTSETIYNRKEFVTDERMGEGCAFCYTYMERTLTFESEKYGISTISSREEGGYFVINLDKSSQTFGKSGADMSNIEHAVEETLEHRNRSFEQSTVYGGLSGKITVNDKTIGGALGFAAQTSIYKYLSASETKGTVSYKNGGIGSYSEKSVSSREIYNKCAVFLAKAFGEKNSDLTLSERAFSELFGKPNGDEKTLSEVAAQKREKLGEQLDRLKQFMEKNLADVRKKDPECGSLKAFADAYLELGKYRYSDITSFVEKMFASDRV